MFPTLSFSLPKKGTVDPALYEKWRCRSPSNRVILFVESNGPFPSWHDLIPLWHLTLLPPSFWNILFYGFLRHHLLLVLLFLLHLFCWLYMPCPTFNYLWTPAGHCPWPLLLFPYLFSLSNFTHSCGPTTICTHMTLKCVPLAQRLSLSTRPKYPVPYWTFPPAYFASTSGSRFLKWKTELIIILLSPSSYISCHTWHQHSLIILGSLTFLVSFPVSDFPLHSHCCPVSAPYHLSTGLLQWLTNQSLSPGWSSPIHPLYWSQNNLSKHNLITSFP